MLTKRQKQIYDFICRFIDENGYIPSLEDIVKNFSDFLKYPSSAHDHVKKLQESGYLEKSMAPIQKESSEPISANKPKIFSQEDFESISIPVLGYANAGLATVLAEENLIGHLKVPNRSIGKKENIFALQIQGDSMNLAQVDNSNIEDGDFVLIDPTYRSPVNGDYVLSIIDGCANIKRFSRDPVTGNIILSSESSNSIHKPIFVSSSDIYMINGKVIRVIKK